MKKNNHRLVLECMVLATEIFRFANEILALVNAAINYSHEPKVV